MTKDRAALRPGSAIDAIDRHVLHAHAHAHTRPPPRADILDVAGLTSFEKAAAWRLRTLYEEGALAGRRVTAPMGEGSPGGSSRGEMSDRRAAAHAKLVAIIRAIGPATWPHVERLVIDETVSRVDLAAARKGLQCQEIFRK